MTNIKDLNPKAVFKFFSEISAIPHGSSNVEAISDYIVNFARKNNLKFLRDDFSNVVIYKKSTKGYETAPCVILQGHLDMVCEKTSYCTKDMDKEGLELLSDGEFVYAKDTTLGGDDGIAVAMMLAILEDDTLVHPKIEAVFTTDEEVGMTGAMGFDASCLEGNIMMNIDSEDEGIFTVSCAGGNTTKCILPINKEPACDEGFSIKISGLIGGHSGCEIHKNTANSNKLMGRLLDYLNSNLTIRVSSINGGLKDNAIPVKSSAVITSPDKEKLCESVKQLEALFKEEYKEYDTELKITKTKVSVKEVMTKECSDKVIKMLSLLPNGVRSMSRDIEGLVETSLNMGIAKTSRSTFELSFCIRSSVDSKKEHLTGEIITFMRNIGGKTVISGDYPGWEYKKDSYLREVMCKVFESNYGYKPKVEALHAGLECGVFADKIPELDCVSFGPDILDIHTPRERMNIQSVERVYRMVKDVLLYIATH